MGIPHSANYDSTTLTITGWIYPRAYGYQDFFNQAADDDTKGYFLNVTGNDASSYTFEISPVGGTGINTGSGSLVINTWQHFAFVRSGNNGYMYLNGVLKGSGNNIAWTPADSEDVRIGTEDAAGICCFYKGTLDDLRIYTRTLSAQEVQRLYNMGHSN